MEPKDLVITITAKADGSLSWKFDRDDVEEQQIMEILRTFLDKIMLDRTIRAVKEVMQKETIQMMNAKNNLRIIKGKN